jgi:hypothetical protein
VNGRRDPVDLDCQWAAPTSIPRYRSKSSSALRGWSFPHRWGRATRRSSNRQRRGSRHEAPWCRRTPLSPCPLPKRRPAPPASNQPDLGAAPTRCGGDGTARRSRCRGRRSDDQRVRPDPQIRPSQLRHEAGENDDGGERGIASVPLVRRSAIASMRRSSLRLGEAPGAPAGHRFDPNRPSWARHPASLQT